MVDNRNNIDWHDNHNAVPLFLKCNCYSEGIEVQYFKEDKSDKGFYINYWKYGIKGRYSDISLWDRIRYACKLLFQGSLHGDQIILDIDKAKKVNHYLEKHIKYDETTNKLN